MLFLAVIGALCDLTALAQIGAMGRDLLLFVTVILAVHGGLLLGVGALGNAQGFAVAAGLQ